MFGIVFLFHFLEFLLSAYCMFEVACWGNCCPTPEPQAHKPHSQAHCELICDPQLVCFGILESPLGEIVGSTLHLVLEACEQVSFWPAKAP